MPPGKALAGWAQGKRGGLRGFARDTGVSDQGFREVVVKGVPASRIYSPPRGGEPLLISIPSTPNHAIAAATPLESAEKRLSHPSRANFWQRRRPK